jgi:hypothetical protein
VCVCVCERERERERDLQYLEIYNKPVPFADIGINAQKQVRKFKIYKADTKVAP